MTPHLVVGRTKEDDAPRSAIGLGGERRSAEHPERLHVVRAGRHQAGDDGAGGHSLGKGADGLAVVVEADRVRRIDAGSGFQLWSERVDREFDDLFRIQEEIARRTVDSLRVRIGTDAEETLRRAWHRTSAPTTSASRDGTTSGDARAYCDGMCALVELGRTAEAVRWAERARRPWAQDPLRYYVACGYARAGLRSQRSTP
jgi:hypothetical protein